jgi:hypothetical protein
MLAIMVFIALWVVLPIPLGPHSPELSVSPGAYSLPVPECELNAMGRQFGAQNPMEAFIVRLPPVGQERGANASVCQLSGHSTGLWVQSSEMAGFTVICG